jgi:hypothetical protein
MWQMKLYIRLITTEEVTNYFRLQFDFKEHIQCFSYVPGNRGQLPLISLTRYRTLARQKQGQHQLIRHNTPFPN